MPTKFQKLNCLLFIFFLHFHAVDCNRSILFHWLSKEKDKFYKNMNHVIREFNQIVFIFRDHHWGRHKIAAFCLAKKISMRCNAPSIQWKKKVFKRIQGNFSLFKQAFSPVIAKKIVVSVKFCLNKIKRFLFKFSIFLENKEKSEKSIKNTIQH